MRQERVQSWKNDPRKQTTDILRCFVAAIIWVLIFPFASEATIIFDNGSPLAGEPGGFSDSEVSTILADDFTLSAAGTVQQIVTYGSYFSGDTLPATDDFTVRFYNDSSGAPAGSPIGSSDLSVSSRTDTGLVSLNGLRVFRYELDLITPQAFSAGTPVWMSLFNDTPSIADDWLWSFTFSVGNNASSNDDGASWGTTGNSHLHFQLFSISGVPEPSTLTLAALGFPVLLRRRRRAQAKPEQV